MAPERLWSRSGDGRKVICPLRPRRAYGPAEIARGVSWRMSWWTRWYAANTRQRNERARRARRHPPSWLRRSPSRSSGRTRSPSGTSGPNPVRAGSARRRLGARRARILAWVKVDTSSEPFCSADDSPNLSEQRHCSHRPNEHQNGRTGQGHVPGAMESTTQPTLRQDERNERQTKATAASTVNHIDPALFWSSARRCPSVPYSWPPRGACSSA